MEAAGIGASQALKDNVASLEKQGRFVEAYDISLEALEDRLGASGLAALQKFNTEADELEREFKQLTAQLQSELLPVFAELARIINILTDATKDFANTPFAKFLLGTDGINADGTIGATDVKVRESQPDRRTANSALIKEAAFNRDVRFKQEERLQRLKETNAKAEKRQIEEIQRLRNQAALDEIDSSNKITQIRLQGLRNELSARATLFQLDKQLEDFLKNRESALADVDLQNLKSELEIIQKGIRANPGENALQKIFDDLLKIDLTKIIAETNELIDSLGGADKIDPADLQQIQDLSARRQNIAAEDRKKQFNDFKTDAEKLEESFNSQLNAIKDQQALLKAASEEERIRIKINRDIQNIKKNAAGFTADQVAELIKQREILGQIEIKQSAINDKLKATRDLYNAIGTTLTDSFLNGLDAVISKTGDLNQILSDTLKQIGRLFIRAGISGLAGDDGIGIFSILAGSFTGKPSGKALGGPVDKNRPYIIGEQGPELFIPESSGQVITNQNMVSAMNRYSPGRNANAMTQVLEDMSDPNGVNSSMFGGSSNSFSNQTEFNNSRSITQGNSTTNFNNNTNSSVFNNSSSTADSSSNMTDGSIHFSMETTVINGIEYATIDQVHAMGARATKEGAKLGEARTLGRLKSSTSVRNKLGM